MKLSMLSIEGNKEYEKKNDIMPIRVQTYYVTAIFMHFLNKIDLDGSGKLVIHFYKKPESENKYMCDKYFHISCYNVDKNVIDKFNTLKKNEFGEFFLDIIVEAFKYIARFNNKEEIIEVIEQAANKVRESKFELILLQKKLSKLSNNKQYKANVYRNINHFGEIWYVEMENKYKKNTMRHEIMRTYVSVSKTEFFKKSYWEDNKFILTDKFDRKVAIVEIKEI